MFKVFAIAIFMWLSALTVFCIYNHDITANYMIDNKLSNCSVDRSLLNWINQNSKRIDQIEEIIDAGH